MQAPGNHQMQNQPDLTFDSDGNSLADDVSLAVIQRDALVTEQVPRAA